MGNTLVPYDPTPEVHPQPTPVPYQNLNVNPNQFGAGIGEAITHAGNEGMEFAQKQQNFTNELYANDTATQGMKALNGAWDDFGNFRGRAAHDNLSGFQDKVEQIYKDTIAQAPNDTAKAMLSKSMRFMADRYLMNGQSHATSQLTVWRDQSVKDKSSELANQAAIAVNDPVLMRGLVESGANEWKTWAEEHALDSESADSLLRKYRGGAYKNIIEERVLTGDLTAAQKIFQDHGEEMDAGSRLAVERSLKPAIRSARLQTDIQHLFGGQDAGEDGIALPQQQQPGDLSPTAISLIKGEEGFAPRAKWDYKQYSGGYGTRGKPGQAYTKESAEADLRSEAGKVDNWLTQNVTTPMNEKQRAALTSFGFNEGTGALAKVLPDINSGDWNRVVDHMRQYNIAGGEVNDVLIGRRKREADLILSKGGSSPEIAGGGLPDKNATFARAAELSKDDPQYQHQLFSELGKRYHDFQTANVAEIQAVKMGWPELVKAAQTGGFDGDMPVPEDRIRTLFPGVPGEKMIRDFKFAQFEGGLMKEADFATPDAIQDMERDLAEGTGTMSLRLKAHRGLATTGPGTTGADPNAENIEFAKERQGLAQRFEIRLRERQKLLTGADADPAAYVANHPDVKTARDGYQQALTAAQGKPDGSPEVEKAKSAWQDYATRSQAMQAALGVPDGQQHLISRGEAINNVSALSKPNADAKGILDSMERQYGGTWETVLKDMATLGNMPPAYQSLQVLDPQNADQLSKFLQYNVHPKSGPDGKEIGPDKGIDEVMKMAIGPAVTKTISAAVASATGIPQMLRAYGQSGGSLDFQSKLLQSIHFLAYAKALSGIDPSTAANEAAAAFTRNTEFLDSQGGAMVPAERIDDVRANVADKTASLSLDQVAGPEVYKRLGLRTPFTDIGDNGQIGSPHLSDWVNRVKANPRWINNPDHSGVWLTDAGVTGGIGRVVRDKDGKPIEVKFADIPSPDRRIKDPSTNKLFN